MPNKKSHNQKFDSFSERPDEAGYTVPWTQGIALASGLLSLRRVLPKPILWTVAGIATAAGVAMYLKNHKSKADEEMA